MAMTEKEHLIVCLGEEGSEIAHICAKILRFGLDDRNVLEPNGPTNLERLVLELNDLAGVIRILTQRGIIPRAWDDFDLMCRKMAKIERFVLYAKGKGTIVDNP